MKTKAFAILCLLLVTAMLSGCLGVTVGSWGNSGAIRGEGEILTFPVETGEFTAIEVGGAFEVIYRQAATSSVTVEIQQNLFDQMNFTLTDGRLTVDSDVSFSVDWGRPPRLTIYAPTLTQVSFSGAVSTGEWDAIVAERFSLEVRGASDASIPLEVGELEVSVSGASSINMRGVADVADFRAAGATDISAGNLQTRIASVAITGAGSVTLACSEQLSVSITGAGSMRYIGDPTVSNSVSGAGSVTQVRS